MCCEDMKATLQAKSANMGARLGLLGVDKKTATPRLAKVRKGALLAYAFIALGIVNWSM